MLSVIASAYAALAAAQVPAAANSNPIVIEGVKQREKAIHNFVRAVTPARPYDGQLKRFQTAVCPAAVGLSDAQNDQITQRLLQVARAIGIRVAPKGCRPNALLIVASDKQELVAALRKRYPAFFSDPLNGFVTLPREPGPAVAWHINGVVSPDHIPIGVGTQFEAHYVSTSADASRLLPATIPHFLAGVLVVEAKGLSGLTTFQVADYAAMRLYAATDPERLKPTASTILGVIDAPVGTLIPLSLTAWDLSFLKALYSTDDRQYAPRQRDAIERLIARDDQTNRKYR